MERDYYFKKELNEGKLTKVCFMTSKMKELANLYKDTVILDTTHKTNQFNLPLLDIIVVDNLGKSCTVFVGLLENQKKESFIWALEAFKENLTSQPIIMFSDEDEALLLGKFFFFLT